MIAVHFDKPLVEQFLRALDHGEPIHCTWNGRNMLLLAGTLYAAVFSQGPQRYQLRGMPKLKDHPTERQEAVEEEFTEDIHAAIQFISQLAFQVMDGEYDQTFEPECQVLLNRENGRTAVRFHKGHKRQQ